MFAFASTAIRRLTGLKSRRGVKPCQTDEFKRRPQVETLEDRRLLSQTVGVFVNQPAAFDGYTLLAPSLSETTYLVDNQGRMVNSWLSKYQPMTSYLITEITQPGTRLKNGDMIRAARLPVTSMNAAGASGRIEAYNWNGKLKWSYTLSNYSRQLHHDFEVLPNGNVLMIAWQRKTREQAVAAGRDPNTLGGSGHLWIDTVIEVKPYLKGHGGKIVWQWSLWDHLVQNRFPGRANYRAKLSDNPQRININFESAGDPGAAVVSEDWTHANGIDYNAELNQIVISVREFSEMWVIEHTKTTKLAKGHTGGQYGKGGDLLYRWGNPRTYGAGTKADQKMWYQHDAHWVPEGYPGSETGNITVFDNGIGRPGKDFSAVLEITPPYNEATEKYQIGPGKKYGPAQTTWRWTEGPNKSAFYSNIISGAVRLPNGNTLIDEGVKGKFIEVDPKGNKVWVYVNPVTSRGVHPQGQPIPRANMRLRARDNLVFRAHKYGPDSPALAGKKLVSGRTIERNDGDTVGLVNLGNGKSFLNNRNSGSTKSVKVFRGGPRAQRVTVIAGDWNGSGKDSVGYYDPKFKHWTFFATTSGGGAPVTKFVHAGVKGSFRPVVGDWNGDGTDTFGYLDANTGQWHLYNENAAAAPKAAMFKWAAFKRRYKPIVGDWNGSGRDSIGFYDPQRNVWLLNNKIDGSASNTIVFKWRQQHAASCIPVIGVWVVDTRDSIGLYNPSTNTWHLNRRNTPELSHTIHFQGPSAPGSWKPIAGNWNGSRLKGQPQTLLLDPQSAGLAGPLGGAALSLTDDQLGPLVNTAVDRLAAVPGTQAVSALESLRFEVVDLPGSRLGQVVGGSTIQIDVDAAGAGWFIDNSPGDDVEFTWSDDADEWLALPGGAALGRVDLLTTVMHELGHVVGHDHSDEGVMENSLSAGVRRTWDGAVDRAHSASDGV